MHTLFSQSIRKFDHEFTYAGLSAALGHELRPNGASKYVELSP